MLTSPISFQPNPNSLSHKLHLHLGFLALLHRPGLSLPLSIFLQFLQLRPLPPRQLDPEHGPPCKAIPPRALGRVV